MTRDEKIAMAMCSSLGIPTWQGNVFIIADRLAQARSQAYEEACSAVKSLRANRPQLLLQLGGMTAQEMRTLIAGLHVAEQAIREAAANPHSEKVE